MNRTDVENQLVDWAEKDRAEPVWRDGRCSSNTYVVLATKKRDGLHNMVCLRPLGGSRYKLKFYPSEKDWGFTEEAFGFGQDAFYDRSEYRGCLVDKDQLQTVVAALKGLRKGRTIKLDVLLYAFEQKYGLLPNVPPPPEAARSSTVPGVEDFKKTVRETFKKAAKKAAEKLEGAISKRITIKPVEPPNAAE